ncbi:MAG: SCO family protein [Rhodospirillales bacterium]|nr:SCO family protein [Rhodospirillales bacterium]
MHRLFHVMIAAAAAIGAALWIGLPAAQAASIGGSFELIDHTGKTVTEESFDDRYLLVYFGYAYCPDVCPTELLIMGQAVDELGELGEEVQPLFVTVDPVRDTVEYLADYVPSFHPRLVGLTGSDEQIHAAARAYRVYYRLNEPDEDGNYLVDHTSYIYFMDPDGDYLTHFVFGQGPEKMAEIIRKHLD